MTDDAQLYDYINEARIQHKFVRKFFNPFIWLDEAELDFTADYRSESDF